MVNLYIVISYIFGFTSGVLSMVLVSFFYGKRMLSKRKESMKNFLSELEKLSSSLPTKEKSVNERLMRVKEITQEQFDLQSQAERPQKNSLDGKHKNGIVSVIKTLEEEKQEILLSILREGYDPEIAVVTSSGSEIMKLSEFMARSDISDPEPTVEKTPTNRLTVIKGGRDDNGGSADGDGSETTH